MAVSRHRRQPRAIGMPASSTTCLGNLKLLARYCLKKQASETQPPQDRNMSQQAATTHLSRSARSNVHTATLIRDLTCDALLAGSPNANVPEPPNLPYDHMATWMQQQDVGAIAQFVATQNTLTPLEAHDFESEVPPAQRRSRTPSPFALSPIIPCNAQATAPRVDERGIKTVPKDDSTEIMIDDESTAALSSSPPSLHSASSSSPSSPTVLTPATTSSEDSPPPTPPLSIRHIAFTTNGQTAIPNPGPTLRTYPASPTPSIATTASTPPPSITDIILVSQGRVAQERHRQSGVHNVPESPSLPSCTTPASAPSTPAESIRQVHFTGEGVEVGRSSGVSLGLGIHQIPDTPCTPTNDTGDRASSQEGTVETGVTKGLWYEGGRRGESVAWGVRW
ncbi:hypothetical protein M409DRAFT_54262 [Zasmidium cellare ATCC 36951]|uniref:Uncharacterized protein n=1 Tax=Zasmidium cellare ATCC 36951 TaxID=1080233 RepID=A0A6A6CLG8_ZASCE|nr:uncharacterized protein M409DRAFT_54262 [Zasmidium cellare ATCC 36951]KAF2167048.1 hypothetical protein M409DRAFT_54262 [Zasmidium cellare ATCC 36951]